MKTLNAAQVKALKQSISSAADDLQHIIEPLTEEMCTAPNVVAQAGMRSAVQRAAQRHLWLAVSDKAFADFGLDLPEYAKAGGTKARLLVDREAVRFTQRLAKGA